MSDVKVREVYCNARGKYVRVVNEVDHLAAIEQAKIDAITWAKETFVLGSNGNEDFQGGVDYCLDAYDKHLEQAAQAYAKRHEK